MYRLTLSLAFGLLLAASIAIKVYANVGSGKLAMYPDDEDITALLSKHGFATDRADPNTDPGWIYGVREGCRVQIANVSPQGWHRSIVEWEATGKILEYSANGRLHDRQPILKPMLVHYLHRLERYAGIDAPAVKVRAIIVAPECPSDVIAPAELAALSD